MSIRALLAPVLDDERITRGLDDAEAQMMVEWLVNQVEIRLGRKSTKSPDSQIRSLCRRARGIARFVTLWCHEQTPTAALQLAATERFAWPLPVGKVDSYDLLLDILNWESRRGQVDLGSKEWME